MLAPTALLLFLVLQAPAHAVNATLHLLPTSGRARCLDGSPAGVYVRDVGATAGWIVAIDGGGWCFNESSCYDRSLTPLGSSLAWPPTRAGLGIESDDCGSNPAFCGYSIALLPYCDGNSQLGSRDDPLVFRNGTFTSGPLWARGLDNLQAALAHLLANTSFATASRVLVDGCSAGGHSSYHHLDRIGDALPAARVVGVADAGMFADLPVLGGGTYYYRSLLTYYFAMHNASAGVPPACLASRPADAAWQCATSPVAAAFLRRPAFAVQSQWDGYQLSNVFAPGWLPEVPASWYACPGRGCSAANNATLLYGWLPGYKGALAAAGMLGPQPRPGGPQHGLFLHSCFVHCQWGFMHQYAIGGDTMYAAFVKWYSGSGTAPGGGTQWVDEPCLGCNPTC